ncbi:MAG: type II toxin-antitoxin system Phd/YefM family antitoxin [Phycisphaerales bacterium]
MIDPRDVFALTDFQRNAKSHIKRLKRTGRAQVLTVNGRAAVVIQDAATYQREMDLAARLAEYEGVRAALEQADAGLGRPFEEFDREFRARVMRRRRPSRKSA